MRRGKIAVQLQRNLHVETELPYKRTSRSRSIMRSVIIGTAASAKPHVLSNKRLEMSANCFADRLRRAQRH